MLNFDFYNPTRILFGKDRIEGNDTSSELTKNETKSIVYMTSDISPAGLMAVYEALEYKLPGKVAVKISTGEPFE